MRIEPCCLVELVLPFMSDLCAEYFVSMLYAHDQFARKLTWEFFIIVEDSQLVTSN